MSLLRGRWRKVLKSLRNDEGFTLMELMIVVMIIAILAGAGFVGYSAIIDNAVKSAAANTASALRTSIGLYEIDKGTSAATLSATALKTELAKYGFDPGGLEFSVYTGDPPTEADSQHIYLKCPSDNETQWEVTIVRNGRTGTATFQSTIAPGPGKGGCPAQ